jgi:hypothetical protein
LPGHVIELPMLHWQTIHKTFQGAFFVTRGFHLWVRNMSAKARYGFIGVVPVSQPIKYKSVEGIRYSMIDQFVLSKLALFSIKFRVKQCIFHCVML